MVLDQYDLAQNTKFASPSIKYEDTAERLYPLIYLLPMINIVDSTIWPNERTLFLF